MIRDACSADASEIAAIWNAVINETSATFTTELKTCEEVASLIDQGPTLVVQNDCLLYTSPSPRDRQKSRMPSSA